MFAIRFDCSTAPLPMCYLDGRLYYATAEGASTALFRLNYRNSPHNVAKLAIYEAPIWLFHNATLSACQQWLYTTGARDDSSFWILRIAMADYSLEMYHHEDPVRDARSLGLPRVLSVPNGTYAVFQTCFPEGDQHEYLDGHQSPGSYVYEVLFETPPLVELRPVPVPPPPITRQTGVDRRANITFYPTWDANLNRLVYVNVGIDRVAHVFDGEWHRADNLQPELYSAYGLRMIPCSECLLKLGQSSTDEQHQDVYDVIVDTTRQQLSHQLIFQVQSSLFGSHLLNINGGNGFVSLAAFCHGEYGPGVNRMDDYQYSLNVVQKPHSFVAAFFEPPPLFVLAYGALERLQSGPDGPRMLNWRTREECVDLAKQYGYVPTQHATF